MKGREWIEEGTFSNKKPALDLGESWPVQVPKGAIIGRTFSLRNHAPVKGQGEGSKRRGVLLKDVIKHFSRSQEERGGLIQEGSVEKTLV